MTTQATIRSSMRTQRQRLSKQEQHRASLDISRHVIRSFLFKRSQRIAVYLPVNGELDPSPIIERIWRLKKTACLPLISSPRNSPLWFISLEPNTRLIRNRYNIWEPTKGFRDRIHPWSIDLILMPLLAFDEQFHRIGMGGGYYDRTLSYLTLRQHWRKPRLLGLAYDFQKVPSIATNPWDIKLDGVVTPSQIYTCLESAL